jgi:hypothetical protein
MVGFFVGVPTGLGVGSLLGLAVVGVSVGTLSLSVGASVGFGVGEPDGAAVKVEASQVVYS